MLGPADVEFVAPDEKLGLGIIVASRHVLPVFVAR